MSQKRVFIAIGASDPLAKSFLPFQKKLRIGADQKEYDIKWTPGENYHVTISFIGETSEEKIKQIEAAMIKVATNICPFDLKIHGMGGFPEIHEARVAWLGVQNKKNLNQLKQSIEDELNLTLQMHFGESNYMPHLTVARLKNPKNIRDWLSPFIRKDFGIIHVDKIILYESIQTGYFPIYKPIFSVHLSGEEPILQVE